MPKQEISRWWRLAGGLSMNLASDTLYAWSIFVAQLEARFGSGRADTGGVLYDRHHTYQVSFYTAAVLAAPALPCEFGAKRLAPVRELVGRAETGL
jgi:hypothetical protein